MNKFVMQYDDEKNSDSSRRSSTMSAMDSNASTIDVPAFPCSFDTMQLHVKKGRSSDEFEKFLDPTGPVHIGEGSKIGSKLFKGQYTVEKVVSITENSRVLRLSIPKVRDHKLPPHCETFIGKCVQKQSGLNSLSMTSQHLVQEWKILEVLKDTEGVLNAIELIDHGEWSILVLQFLEGPTLLEMLNQQGPLSEAESKIVISTLLCVLIKIHQKNIVHLDIKPENLMFKEKNNLASITIIDFGLASYVPPTITGRTAGTIGYIAPELLQGNSYDTKADIFSTGVIMFLCITGTHPFYKQLQRYIEQPSIDFDRTYDRISFVHDIWQTCSLVARSTVLNLCAMEARSRPTAKEALQNLPWFNNPFRHPISRASEPIIPSFIAEGIEPSIEIVQYSDSAKNIEVSAGVNKKYNDGEESTSPAGYVGCSSLPVLSYL
eukprot:Filipodium_phascolosomae@DN7980_c0_g1_i1.p1